MTNSIRVRIAPSPTGDPHIGTVYAALFNWAFAKKHSGEFVLRIEDTDRTRLVEGSEEKILSSLRWLGLDHAEGPDIGGPFKPYRQSERKDIYFKYAQELVKKGNAYDCFCLPERLQKVREEQQKRGESPKYDRHCRNLSGAEIKHWLNEKKPYVVRLKVPEGGETGFKDIVRGEITFQNKDIDDQVLLKSDGFPTYHLAVVVDDYLMNITHVIRAEEWISSTPKHVLLYQAFGWKLPQFAHLPLLRNPDKSKISKRKNHTSVLWYKEQGYLPEAILNFLSLLGWSHPGQKEVFSLQEFVEKFSLERIDPSGPVFNLEKLDWLNGEYIRDKSVEELFDLIVPFAPNEWPRGLVKKVVPLVQERIKKLYEFRDLTSFFFEEPQLDLELLAQGEAKASQRAEVLEKALVLLKKQGPWEKEGLEKNLRAFADQEKIKASVLFMSLRIALTGKTATPPLFDTMEVLGRTKSLERLTKAINLLN